MAGDLSFFSHSQAEATVPLVDPVCIVQAHRGPAYDVRFYPDLQQPLLFR
jgi:THO complex subunit 6